MASASSPATTSSTPSAGEKWALTELQPLDDKKLAKSHTAVHDDGLRRVVICSVQGNVFLPRKVIFYHSPLRLRKVALLSSSCGWRASRRLRAG